MGVFIISSLKQSKSLHSVKVSYWNNHVVGALAEAYYPLILVDKPFLYQTNAFHAPCTMRLGGAVNVKLLGIDWRGTSLCSKQPGWEGVNLKYLRARFSLELGIVCLQAGIATLNGEGLTPRLESARSTGTAIWEGGLLKAQALGGKFLSRLILMEGWNNHNLDLRVNRSLVYRLTNEESHYHW